MNAFNRIFFHMECGGEIEKERDTAKNPAKGFPNLSKAIVISNEIPHYSSLLGLV